MTMVALIGDHLPFSGRQQPDVGCPGAAIDLRAEFACAGRHGVGDVGRRHVAVVDGQESGLDAEGFEIGMMLPDFVGAEDVGFIAGEPGQAVDVAKPVHFLIGDRQADAAAAMPADRLAGQRFQFRIETGAVHMHLGHVQRTVEMRALARRMPGRAGSQLALFHQHDVAPAFERQMVEQAHAHDAAADDHHSRMGLHHALLHCLAGE